MAQSDKPPDAKSELSDLKSIIRGLQLPGFTTKKPRIDGPGANDPGAQDQNAPYSAAGAGGSATMRGYNDPSVPHKLSEAGYELVKKESIPPGWEEFSPVRTFL